MGVAAAIIPKGSMQVKPELEMIPFVSISISCAKVEYYIISMGTAKMHTRSCASILNFETTLEYEQQQHG